MTRENDVPVSVIACDLGTGSTKAALYRADGVCVAECVVPYETHYPESSFHEQRPLDWWDSVVESIQQLTAGAGAEAQKIGAIGISGHSLGCVPLSADHTLLQDRVPIWSDGRASQEAASFFERVDFGHWYGVTGNGFPAPLYPIFKLMWLRRHRPEIFGRTATVIGTKDYVNYRLTGRLATDPSYASGCGAFDLRLGDYADHFLASAGLSRALFPAIVPSSEIIGEVLADVARMLGLPSGVKVVCGGVDNSCMALGANTFREGDVYCAMGSSSWLTVASAQPVTHETVLPFVFAHVVPGFFVSATSIFSSGSSLAYVHELLARGDTAVEASIDLAHESPRGAHGLLFVPTLGGGTSFEGGPEVRGAFVGLDLKHRPADIVRATLEGIGLALGVALQELRAITFVRGEMLVVGGGSRSALWRQILADAFDCEIVKTGIDRQAASLGAAALALVGIGAWKGFSALSALHVAQASSQPDGQATVLRDAMLSTYRQAAIDQRKLAPALQQLRRLSGPSLHTRQP